MTAGAVTQDRSRASRGPEASGASASLAPDVEQAGGSIRSRPPEFARISPEPWAALQRAATLRRFEPNGFIYLQDDEAQSLYFVVSGHVRLSYLMEDGSAVLHAILPPGETFGELGIFERSTYCDMATAVGPTVVAGIPLGAFTHLTARHPEIGEALARVVARRYRGYVLLTRDLSLKTLAARLAQAVLRLADSLGTRTTRGRREVGVLGSIVTQTDLGLMARGSRGNINRVLKTWERAGWIAIEDRRTLILDRARLEGVATEDV